MRDAWRKATGGDRSGWFWFEEGHYKIEPWVVEAAMAGLPIVTTRVPGVDDVVVDGVTGLIVAPDDVVAMVDALERLARSAELRARMGAAARTHAVDQFSIDDVIAAWKKALDGVVGRDDLRRGA